MAFVCFISASFPYARITDARIFYSEGTRSGITQYRYRHLSLNISRNLLLKVIIAPSPGLFPRRQQLPRNHGFSDVSMCYVLDPCATDPRPQHVTLASAK